MARKTGYFFNTHYSRHYSHYSEKHALLGTIIHIHYSKLSLLRVLILSLTGQLQILAARVGGWHLLANGLHRLLMFLV